MAEAYKSILQEQYEQEFVSKLMKTCGLENKHEVPKLLKVVVSMGVKEAIHDSKAMDKAVEDLYAITGQKPVVTKAKKAIAGFKLRENSPIGCKVTLRKHMMYDFVKRFVNIALPRVKDFRGLSAKKFDGNGNYAVGIQEHLIFPEINYDKVDKTLGMNIVFVTSAKTDEHALELFKLFNFPFAN